MQQQAELGLNLSTWRTRKREFHAQIERKVPWPKLETLIAPQAPGGRRGRPPFAERTMLGIHFMQQRLTLSDPVMEGALHDASLFRGFAGLHYDTRLPDGTTILRFRQSLEDKKLAAQILETVDELLQSKGLLLKAGTAVDATLIAAPSSTKNARGAREREMRQIKNGNQWHLGMKAYIAVDAESGLVHIVIGTAANFGDVIRVNSLLHREECDIFGGAGYQGAAKWPDASVDVTWHIAMRPDMRRALDRACKLPGLIDQLERRKASICVKVKHPFCVVKRQFGHLKVRHRGLSKNTAQLTLLFALSNLCRWRVRRF